MVVDLHDKCVPIGALSIKKYNNRGLGAVFLEQFPDKLFKYFDCLNIKEARQGGFISFIDLNLVFMKCCEVKSRLLEQSLLALNYSGDY